MNSLWIDYISFLILYNVYQLTKKVIKKVKTGKFKKGEKIKVPNGFYKNGKPKFKPGHKQGDPEYRNKKIDVEYNHEKKEKTLQGERIEHPDYMNWGGIKKEIDYSHYISNQIMNPVKQLLDIAIDPEETSKLFNSFIK